MYVPPEDFARAGGSAGEEAGDREVCDQTASLQQQLREGLGRLREGGHQGRDGMAPLC